MMSHRTPTCHSLVPPPDALGEAGVGGVQVEEDDTPGQAVVHPVRHTGNSCVERPRACAVDAVAADEARLTLEDEERIHLVGVIVRPDSLPLGLDLETERGDPGEVGEDRDRPVTPLEPLAVARRRNDRVGNRPAAVRRRLVLVELAPPAEILGEARARRMEVQEPQLTGAVVVEAVDEPWRNDYERSGRNAQRLEIRADPQAQMACEHVERIEMMQVDVRLGAALPGRMSRPGDVEQVVVAEDAQLAVRRVRDRLTLPVGGP